MVEGPICTIMENVRDYSVHVLQHFNGWNSQSLISCSGQSSIAHVVPPRSITIAVIIAVNLDQQPSRDASEIRHIAADGILLSELQSARPFAQDTPQQHFMQTHLAPERARKADVLIGRADSAVLHASPILPGTGRWQRVSADGGVNVAAVGPTTMLRMVPLPVPGRI